MLSPFLRLKDRQGSIAGAAVCPPISESTWQPEWGCSIKKGSEGLWQLLCSLLLHQKQKGKRWRLYKGLLCDHWAKWQIHGTKSRHGKPVINTLWTHPNWQFFTQLLKIVWACTVYIPFFFPACYFLSPPPAPATAATEMLIKGT